MMVSHNYFTSSIGKKQIMALTGFGLLGFTFTHMAGNLLLFLGGDSFNYYAHQLISNKFIYVAEAGLAGLFLLHIVLAILLRLQNMAARPVSYYVKTRTTRGETFASMTMPATGMIILLFLIIHLINFKYGSYYETTIDGETVRDLYRTVVEYFANPVYVAWYVFAMLALGLHTSHGVKSAFQTWGANHPKYNQLVELASLLYGLTVAVLFSAMAIFCHFQN